MISIGVDVGGTFTDLVMIDSTDGSTHVLKVPSTPHAFDVGVVDSIDQLTSTLGDEFDSSQISEIAHGTTVAINTILQRRGARVAFFLTAGFEDTLFIGDGHRSDIYDLVLIPEAPVFLGERRMFVGVDERMAADGTVVTKLDEEKLAASLAATLNDSDIETVAFCFLNSYVNPSHESQAAQLAKRLFPHITVVTSYEVLPKKGEYKRLVATGLDSYVRANLSGYLSRVQSLLQERGITAPLTVMRSSGGRSSAASVAANPVTSLLSGLAAGVVGAAQVARDSDIANCLTIDIGGTSADVAVIRDGRPVVSVDGRVDTYPLPVAMVDVHTIGAGGSSIAALSSGALRVGPLSAGADPGPVCYGRGGTQPTVTDASLVLGYLDESNFAGGLQLQRTAAEEAIAKYIAEPLGLSVEDAALGIHTVVNANMAEALRLISVARGHDPRDFTLVAFGGAGPVHAGAMTGELEIPRILIPPHPGVLSANGLLNALIEHEASASCFFRPHLHEIDVLHEIFSVLSAKCTQSMKAENALGDVVEELEFQMRYVGQSHELTVRMEAKIDQGSVERAVALFHQEHRERYTYAREEAPIEVTALRVVHILQTSPLQHSVWPWPAPADEPTIRTRSCRFPGDTQRVDVAVLTRSELPRDYQILGPAIVEQPDTTTVIYPGQRAWVDDRANLVIESRP